MTVEWEPDIFDLSDWVCGHCRPLFDVARYLSDGEAQYQLLYNYWVEQGRPAIDSEPAYGGDHA